SLHGGILTYQGFPGPCCSRLLSAIRLAAVFDSRILPIFYSAKSYRFRKTHFVGFTLSPRRLRT
ncbi:hypothetical protein, partial [Pandoraea apista]|uniref:hypothetical protein n=1 Tax=Pandoraea apista TaxID=93218 RepID=UPI001C8BCEA6